MTIYDLTWDFGAFDAPLTATATTYTLPHGSDPVSIVFSGTGFTYDGNGVPTGGTITSISVVINDGGGVLATLTNVSISLADFGAALADIYALRAQVGWQGVLAADPEPTIQTATQIRLANDDGTFTDVIGSGFDVTVPGSFLGTVTAIQHIASDGTTVLTNVPLSTTLQEAASALYEVVAGDQLFALINQGANTLTSYGAIAVGADTYSLGIEDGAGNDAIIGANPGMMVGFEFATAGVTVNIAAGTATGGGGSNTLTNIKDAQGSNFGDTLSGDNQNNIFDGRAGNDTIYGGGGDDFIDGGGGDDYISGGAGSDWLFFDEEDAPAGVTVNLGITSAQNTGSGTDTIIGVENVIGTASDDVITGSGAINELLGNFGNDQLNGGGGADILRGGDGNDTLDGGSGVDAMYGGDGDDIYIVTTSADQTIEDVGATGIDLVRSSVTRTLGARLENLTLTGPNAIWGTGNELNNVITGNAAANRLIGAAGNDTLIGGNGDDLLIGGTGADTINGGSGVDTLDYSASDAAVVINLSTNSASGGHAAGDVISNCENIVGSTSADNLTGNNQANIINGGNGNDTLSGVQGDDTLNGGAGDDYLDGGSGADTMVGGAGNDTYVVTTAADVTTEVANGDGIDLVLSSVTRQLGSFLENLTLTGSGNIWGTGNSLANVIIGNSGNNRLNGGAGNDTLNGGLGADELIGSTGADHYVFDSALGGGNIDTITGFSAVDDTIDLDDAIFTGLSAGTLDANAFRIGAAALDADDRIIYNSATGALLWDADGNGAGAAIQFATISTGLALTNADFLVA